jgi:cytochrome c
MSSSSALRTAKLSALSLAAVGLAAAAILWQPSPVAARQTAEASSPGFYTKNVQPILQANCYRCHGGMNHRGGLQIDTHEHLMKGGKDGVVLVPGHPESSLLLKLIRHEGPADDPMPMPPNKDKLSDADIATVTAWIKAGAVMPPDAPAQ